MSALVTCWSCNAQYAPSMHECPSCRAEYRPSEEELLAVATQEAFELLTSGIGSAKVRANLTSSHDLPDQLLDDALSAAQSRVRDASKTHGWQIAGSGCLLLLIALGVFVVSGGFLMATGCLVLGGLMLGAGILKARTGWNITGHDFE